MLDSLIMTTQCLGDIILELWKFERAALYVSSWRHGSREKSADARLGNGRVTTQVLYDPAFTSLTNIGLSPYPPSTWIFLILLLKTLTFPEIVRLTAYQ